MKPSSFPSMCQSCQQHCHKREAPTRVLSSPVALATKHRPDSVTLWLKYTLKSHYSRQRQRLHTLITWHTVWYYLWAGNCGHAFELLLRAVKWWTKPVELCCWDSFSKKSIKPPLVRAAAVDWAIFFLSQSVSMYSKLFMLRKYMPGSECLLGVWHDRHTCYSCVHPPAARDCISFWTTLKKYFKFYGSPQSAPAYKHILIRKRIFRPCYHFWVSKK